MLTTIGTIAAIAIGYVLMRMSPLVGRRQINAAIRGVVQNAISDGIPKERAVQNAVDYIEKNHRNAMMTARLYRAAIRDIAATHYAARQQQAA